MAWITHSPHEDIMTLERTADHIYCQTCATAWALDDEDGRHYFRSTTTYSIGDNASPKQIADLVPAEEMTFCPACDTEQLAPSPLPNAPSGVKGRDQFYERDDKMIGADVDAGYTDDGTADVTHDARED